MKKARTKIFEEDSGIAPYSGNWDSATATHLLKRTMIGITKPEMDQLSAMTMSDAVNSLLADPGPTAPPVNNYNSYLQNPDPIVAEGDPWVYTPLSQGNVDFARRLSYVSWIYHNMMFHGTSIHEKMVLFWHNLLVTNTEDLAILNYQYMDMLRENALGNFRDIIKKLTLNPRMLNYLNGSRNIATQPDENYARELQELFCIGKGPDSEYTERDVQEAARVLTGWYNDYRRNVEGNVPIAEYWEGNHDPGTKTFSAFYSHARITGKTGPTGGEEEIDELLDMIFSNNETALHICRKLFNYFVYTEITPEIESELIQPLATLFRDSNYEIAPVMEALLTSDVFYREEYRGALIKSPSEFLLGTWRTLGMDYQDPNDLTQQFWTCLTLSYYMERIGMDIGNPPSVAGWPAYYQKPLKDQSWISTDTITYRARITDMIANDGLYINNNGNVLWLKTDLIAFVKQLDQPDDVYALINDLAQILLGIELSDEQVTNLRNVLLSGQSDDFYWWDAWNSHINFPNEEMYRTTVENRLKPLFRVMFQYSEFNLM